MSFEIELEEEENKIYRIIGDKDNLIGVITKSPSPDEFRVEMMMKIESEFFPTYKEARAYSKGVEDTLRAYKLIPKEERKNDDPFQG